MKRALVRVRLLIWSAIGLTAVAVQESLEFSLQVPVNAFLFCTLSAIALTPPANGFRRKLEATGE